MAAFKIIQTKMKGNALYYKEQLTDTEVFKWYVKWYVDLGYLFISIPRFILYNGRNGGLEELERNRLLLHPVQDQNPYLRYIGPDENQQ